MDLRAIVNNDGPAPDKQREGRGAPVGSDGLPHYPPSMSHQHSSASGSGPHPTGRNVTPLYTPNSQQPDRGQHPFPGPHHQYQQLPPQSPALSQHGQQYSQYPPQTPQSATTPGPRPASNGYQQSHPSPSRYQAPGIPISLHHSSHQHHVSHSPTPPVHQSPGTQSTRKSPLTAMPGHSNAPMYAHGYHPQQRSQPSTPLAPPHLPPHRSSGQSYTDTGSPHHSRTMSGASNGYIAGSPAQRNASINNLVGSPGPHSRQPSHARRSSEYHNQQERERSQSVSPKTIVGHRRPSMGSRQSSMQDPPSARSSVQPNYTPSSESQSHIGGGSRPLTYAQNATANLSVAQHTPLAHSSHSSQPLAVNSGPQAGNPLSQDGQSRIHQSHSMGLNQLLTPTNEHAPSVNGSQMAAPNEVKRENSNISVKSSPGPKSSAAATPPSAPPREWQQRPQEQSIHAVALPKVTAKRAIDSDPAMEPPSKRGKTRKFTERPVWARLARTNPRFDELQSSEGRTQAPQPHQSQSHPQATHAPPPPPVQNQMPSNGMRANGNAPAAEPWLQNPPLDQDLMHARNVLGQWEKSARWNTPYPDLLKAVQDWIYAQLAGLEDIGNNPEEGSIEIEAKIGQIIDKDREARLQMPVMNAVVLAPSYHHKIRFESEMDDRAFKVMNEYLNKTLRESMTPGRVHMKYAHPKEVDSFRKLSKMGYEALPLPIQRNKKLGRGLNLRTSTVIETREVKARIVKVKIDDLHIYNPNGEYDCRISINLEANLNRPDLHPNDMSEEPTPDNPAPRDRKKDRLSYKHLEYSFDLTKVEQAGMQPKYELELEVNAATLRDQMKRMSTGEPDAFGDVVSGFVDNATFLMRLKPDSAK